MNFKKIELDDLTITRLEDGNCRLQSGRVSRWRMVNSVNVRCISGDHILEFDDLYIDIGKAEADQLADFLGKRIVFSDE